MTVAVLFARADSYYKTLPECDVWDAERDARNWPGAVPGVFHPPCRAWGGLSHMAKPRHDEKDLGRWSVAQVRKWGGVLEHPKKSKLWADQDLPRYGMDKFGGWTLPIFQSSFGHRAEKSTLLYIVGCAPQDIPVMPFVLGDALAVCGTSVRRKDGGRNTRRPEISKSEREHTPPELAKWLVELAKRCKVHKGVLHGAH